MNLADASSVGTICEVKLLSSTIAVLLALFLSVPLRADVCIWRDPERTMERLFPTAHDYRTRTIKMTPKWIAAIERQLGEKLEESERREFDLYEITGRTGANSTTLGTVLALAGKGEYGAIEVVIGVDDNGKVVGAYIQRVRERASKALQSPEFLGQFAGKTKHDGFGVNRDVKPASPDALAASRVVASVIRKMLVFHDVLSSGEAK